MTMILLNNNLSPLNANSLELHYYFKDQSHTMDAFVQNKCEYDFLGVIKEIASLYDLEVIVETEPLADGGIRRWFKIISKEESKKATVKIAIVVSLITGVFVTPITSSIETATKNLIERIFEDPEIKNLEKEKLKLEIEKLKIDIQGKNNSIQQNILIKRKRSNFYESLEKYPKVHQVSFLIKNDFKKAVDNQRDILRENFKDFVLTSDDLEPVIVENAIIEIISPVLKDGSYRWMGIYNGSIIPFNMKSLEFKIHVKTGIVQFKNGTSIDCYLEIRKKIDNEGLEKIVGYDVLRVNNYFENDKPVETPEGRHHRQKKEADKRQLDFNFSESNYQLFEMFLPIVKPLLSDWDEADTREYLKLALEIEEIETSYYLRMAVETDSSRAASAISEGIREILTAQALVLVKRMEMLRSNDREKYTIKE